MENNLIATGMQAMSTIAADKNNAVIKELYNSKNQQLLPLLIKPGNKDVDLVEWLKQNKQQFEDDLVKFGGIILKGFNIDTVDAFSTFTKCFNTDPLPYMFRSSPRHELSEKIKNVYTSTIYPRERTINMHNESSYSRVWGKK